jgi:hypothetical protein
MPLNLLGWMREWALNMLIMVVLTLWPVMAQWALMTLLMAMVMVIMLEDQRGKGMLLHRGALNMLRDQKGKVTLLHQTFLAWMP